MHLLDLIIQKLSLLHYKIVALPKKHKVRGSQPVVWSNVFAILLALFNINFWYWYVFCWIFIVDELHASHSGATVVPGWNRADVPQGALKGALHEVAKGSLPGATWRSEAASIPSVLSIRGQMFSPAIFCVDSLLMLRGFFLTFCQAEGAEEWRLPKKEQ